MISANDILEAEVRIRQLVRQTPLDRSIQLSEMTGCDIWLKLEHLQYTGSFKLRGATNRILSLFYDELERGIVTASNGNHGIAVCHAAQRVGVTPQVFMRQGVSEAIKWLERKAESLRRNGGQGEPKRESSGPKFGNKDEESITASHLSCLADNPPIPQLLTP